MPITRSAKKALRQSFRKKVYNDRRKKAVKEISKKVIRFVADKKTTDAKEALRLAYKAIDKAAKNGTIKKNTAARRKSRLARMVK